MSALDHVSILMGRRESHVFMWHWRTEVVDAVEVPERLADGWTSIAVDPDDAVTWYVHRDIAEALLRRSA